MGCDHGTIAGIVDVTDTRHWKKRLYGWWWMNVVWHLPLRLLALWVAWRIVWATEFDNAIAAVKVAATSPECRNIHTWGDNNRRAIETPKQAENMYRHLYAAIQLKGSPTAHTAVELAWQAYKLRGR